ncbi:CCA tRNA nucleotidyltransferase 1, mitochondrial isoform X1 [Drosophila teissieri]|uniref:CCA tRNA nucleotidyltransferase 1, mitochondrial isoform X1 n=1 Tax=Drosophila teissieri TaxID=7243 RepID=UPI001CBA1058|nr:CCA tRNA nucleotidyltransferase 1, mitochondrial isoform X1 [Drosophila teissieri]
MNGPSLLLKLTTRAFLSFNAHHQNRWIKTMTSSMTCSRDASPELIAQLGKPPRMRTNPAFRKIATPEFQSIFTPELNELVALFKKYDYELRIAGGAVRDILMGIPPKDIDLATTATPEQMKQMFGKEEVRMINANGEKHGTITPRINDKENFEVTTLRVDIRTDGRHAEVMYTTDWQLDANRRDLTINSMFLGFDGTVYDYFYAYDDLQERRVVFVGEADIRIKEDFLRILRYFRFYGRIASEESNHDKATLEAIKENAKGLTRISGERIWSELQKIVVGNFGTALFLQMHRCKLLEYIGLPKEPYLKEFDRLCKALDQFEKPHHPILYLTGMLHSVENAIEMHKRLKLSAYERDLARFITQEREKVDSQYTTLRHYQKLCLQKYIQRDFVEQLLKYSGKLELYNQLKSWVKPDFPIRGNALAHHGLNGIRLGLVMDELKLLWADSDFQLTHDDLLKKIPNVLEKIPSSSSKVKRMK